MSTFQGCNQSRDTDTRIPARLQSGSDIQVNQYWQESPANASFVVQRSWIVGWVGALTAHARSMRFAFEGVASLRFGKHVK